MHCLARETIASKELWIIRCSRLRHAVTIELRSSSKFFGFRSCGTFQICCLRYPPPKKSRILPGLESAVAMANVHVCSSVEKELTAKVLYCCITGMGGRSILLPPHVILIDVMNVKVPLYNMITYNA